MSTLNACKKWICLFVILFSTGCGVDSGSDRPTPNPNNSNTGVARVELVSDALTVDYNGSITLSWTTSQVQDCVALGDWSGAKSTSGSETIDLLIADSSFELDCYEIDGAQESSAATASKGKLIKSRVDISVRGPKQPTLSMSASPATVSLNGATTISWSSKFANSCTASGAWSGNKATSGSQTISALTADVTFNLACSGDGGSASGSVSITVAASSNPWVSLTSDSSSLPYDGSTTLNWNSGNTSGCTASGDWSGALATAGSQTTGALTADSTFNITCSGAGGSASDSVSITVAPSVPTLSFSASPTSVNENGSTTLSWNGGDVTDCWASGDWSGNKTMSGSETVGALTNDSTFTLTCSGSGGTVTETVDVTVTPIGIGTALLTWIPPTQNTDGSTLTDLAGYKIRYGTSPGSYSNTITLDNQGLSSYLVENLSSADWYFVLTSFNAAGIESSYSNEISKTID